MFDIQLLRDRDRESWDSLYRSTCARTYRVLHHVTGAPQLVLEELNQDVWLSAIDSVDRLDGTKGTAVEWVLGIARFKGLTHLRRHYANRLVIVSHCTDRVDSAEAVDEAIDGEERRALIRAAMESLPDHWQNVLRQKYEAGMSVMVIADMLGTTPKAVESILSRARQRLRDLIQQTILQEEER